MNKDSIEFSLSTWTWSGFKLSWLKSYTRTRSYHFQALFALNPIYFYSHYWLTLNQWSSQSLVTFIHSQALGLRGLCSQLGTAVKYGTEQVRMGRSWVGLLWNKGIWQQNREQPWPQLVCCASICCCVCGCIFQKDWIVVRSFREEWYRLIGVRIGQGEGVDDFNLRTKELGCNY